MPNAYVALHLGKLTPEGLACTDSGQCGIGKAKKYSEGLGYKFYIYELSFIKKVNKKYQPDAIVGVGCQIEIKEGLDLCHRDIGFPH